MTPERYRELARAAFPDGFLAVRGVVTVGGLTCLNPDLLQLCNAHGECVNLTDPRDTDTDRALFDSGDLLPDYSDPLTAHAIRSELAVGLNLWDGAAAQGVIVEPYRNSAWKQPLYWTIRVRSGVALALGGASFHNFGHGIEDEAEAVLTEIARLRVIDTIDVGVIITKTEPEHRFFGPPQPHWVAWRIEAPNGHIRVPADATRAEVASAVHAKLGELGKDSSEFRAYPIIEESAPHERRFTLSRADLP